MKKLLILFTLMLFLSCKKDESNGKKYKVTYTFDSGSSVANKYYNVNDDDIRPIAVGNKEGKQSIDVMVSIGDKIRAVMMYKVQLKGVHEISVSYNNKEIAYTDKENKIGLNDTVIQLDKTFTKSDFE